jgi:hypothetical protein
VNLRPVSAYNSSVAAALSLTLNLSTEVYGRSLGEVWVKSSAAADFNVYGSRNGVDWRLVDTISLAAAGEEHRGYRNAYAYIKVETSATNDNEIEICASRA